MVLTAQNVALSLQLSTKEVLASRCQTGVAVIVQLLGLVTEGIISDAFRRSSLVTKGCRCLHVFWWVWFSNCLAPESNDMYSFWLYFALRCCLIVESTLVS
jgi:hypothetical protein